MEQWVLDHLTDAQKRANTTRGSTPGLIDLALPDTLENRIPLPAVVAKERSPKTVMVDASKGAARQLAPKPAPGALDQGAQVAQARPTRQPSSLTYNYKDEQPSQSPRASSSGIATALSPQAMGAPSHTFVKNEAERVLENTSCKVRSRC